jgi:RimJ/RimL family protein N-acetyltransferase
MELELYSERLYLRPFDPSDLDLDIEMATDPDVMKYFGGAVTEERITAESTNFTRRCSGGCIGVWTVIGRLTQEKLGEVFLTPLPIDAEDTQWELIHGDDIPDGEIEIGYTSLEELVAVTDPENTASQRVLGKCGLVYEGMRRAYAAECLGYRITRQRWLEDKAIGS